MACVCVGMCVVLPFLPFRTEGCLLFDLLAFVEAAALLERRLIVVRQRAEYTGESSTWFESRAAQTFKIFRVSV